MIDPIPSKYKYLFYLPLKAIHDTEDRVWAKYHNGFYLLKRIFPVGDGQNKSFDVAGSQQLIIRNF